jgi:hypothetical protein
VGSDSAQGAGAPTMFQAMRRIVAGLANNYVGEGTFERTIRQSFLGMSFSYKFVKMHVSSSTSIARLELLLGRLRL